MISSIEPPPFTADPVPGEVEALTATGLSAAAAERKLVNVHQDSTRRMKLVSLREILQEKRPEPYLVKGRFPAVGLSTVYGDSNCGKTWLCINLACRIAAGYWWADCQIKQGPVVYHAGERLEGLETRFAGWLHSRAGRDSDIMLSDKGGALEATEGFKEVLELLDELPKPPRWSWNLQPVTLEVVNTQVYGCPLVSTFCGSIPFNTKDRGTNLSTVRVAIQPANLTQTIFFLWMES